MSREPEKESSEKPAITLLGTVEKIIPAIQPVEPEKAQISLEGADHLYREIRVENILKNEDGKTVRLKPGAHEMSQSKPRNQDRQRNPPFRSRASRGSRD